MSAFDYGSDISFINLPRDFYIQKLTLNNYYAVLAVFFFTAEQVDFHTARILNARDAFYCSLP